MTLSPSCAHPFTANGRACSIRLLEIGASAGSLLRCDHYRYEAGGRGWGDPESPVRFVDAWVEGIPPVRAPLRILDRRGCDQHPLDPSRKDDRLALLSYTLLTV